MPYLITCCKDKGNPVSCNRSIKSNVSSLSFNELLQLRIQLCTIINFNRNNWNYTLPAYEVYRETLLANR